MTRFMLALVALILAFSPVFAGEKADEATYRKIENQLDATVLDTVAYDEADVTEVIKDFARNGRITIVLDKKALEEVDEDDRLISLELADIKLGNALNIVLDQIGLVKSYKNGVLYITTEEKAKGVTITKIYDIRDITVKIRNFPAPTIRLRSNEGDGQGPIVVIPDEEPDDPEVDDVVEIIEDTIDADWGDTASISVIKGQLIIRATRVVHKSVASLLGQLRASK